MKKSILILIIFSVLVFVACNSDDDNNTDDTFDVEAMLNNIVTNNIIPTINSFATEANTLEQFITTYINTPTESNLELARQQWKITAIAYEETYVYHIGEIRDQFIHNSIYNWPTVSGAIEFFISDNDSITEDFMNTISSQAKSIAAIEYLLFEQDLSTTNSVFINSQKRRDYLKLCVSYLASRGDILLNIWSTNGENYTESFIDNEGSGLDGSINLYYNGIHNALDVTKTTKVGKPAGLENSQVINPELTQAFYSDTSLDLIRASIKSVENAYFSNSGLGIDDYVFSITENTELNDAIQNKINEAYTKIDAITIPLDEAVTQNNSLVADLHTTLEDLRILVAVDVQSILSIIITTTDTDGD